MMKLSKALMLSVSGLFLMSGGSLASIHNLTSFNTSGAVTFVHTSYTHTSHPRETLLSSFEDFFPKEPSPYSYRGSRRGCGKLFKPSLSLPKDSGRGWGGFHNTSLIQLAATCFVTDTSACSGNEFSGNNADDDGHGSPGGPGDVLPAGRVTVMIMIWIMKNAVARKDIPKPPVPKVRNLPTPAPTTALISKNASLPVRVITLLARSRITAWERRVTANMLPVNARPAAQGMITPPFPMVMFRTERLVWIATVRPSIKSNPIRATALWTAAPWAEKPGLKPACREQPPCMTIVRLVPTWVNTQPVRAAPYASMKNARVCGMPPAVQRIVRIIVTSAAGEGLLLIPSPLRGEG